MNMRIAIGTAIGCVAALPLFGSGAGYVGSAAGIQGAKPPKSAATTWAALGKLPSLGSNAEAHAVNDAGTVIVGQSFDRAGYLYAVKWTLQNGAWAISTLPYPGPAATAKGIDNDGNVVGYAANVPRRRVFWPASGGHAVLPCDIGEAMANGISADGQVVVGQSEGRATAGRAPGYCSETLPPLAEGQSASARAVNGDGSVIGGIASLNYPEPGVPVRWIVLDGQHQIQQLDEYPGTVFGANAIGDLAGRVTIPCAVEGGCSRAMIWFAGAGSRDLGTLGGADSWARDINSAGEVVGLSTSPQVGNTAFFWSATMGMLKLPAKGWAGANALSDVRSDGTRIVVGLDARANAVVWVVRNP